MKGGKTWMFFILPITISFMMTYTTGIHTSLSQTENYSTYENITSGFKIQYPNDWKVVPRNWSNSIYDGGVFESPNKAISFSVLIESTNQTFEEWSSDELHFINNIIDITNTLSRLTHNPEMRESLDSQRTILNGLPAWQMVKSNSTWVRNEIGTIKDNYAYKLVSEADLTDTKVYLPTFGKMWNSFQIIR